MKLKVCGMKHPANTYDLVKLNPDFIGFIFYNKSKRFVGEDFEMPEVPPAIKKVGVFVNEDVEKIIALTKKHALDYVQLHGEESIVYCNTLLQAGVKIIKAFAIDKFFDFSILHGYQNYCEYFLFDTRTPLFGGSGKKFDWAILDDYKLNKPFILSGGIDVKDAGELKRLSGIYKNMFAVDLNSRFETEPGVKSISKIKNFKHLQNQQILELL